MFDDNNIDTFAKKFKKQGNFFLVFEVPTCFVVVEGEAVSGAEFGEDG